MSTRASLAVELWSAEVEWQQRFIDDVEVLAPVPARRPARVRLARTDGDLLTIGRHADEDLDDHLAWTGPGHAEDRALSRSQLQFSRFGEYWQVKVPGPAESRRRATVRYWASNDKHGIEAGQSLILMANARACIAVTTPRRCYWALVTTPAAAAASDAPSRSGSGSTQVDRESDDEAVPRLPAFPKGWREAVHIKFRPFLTWPMDINPGLVRPADFVAPETGRRLQNASQAENVRRRLGGIQAAAATRGFEPPAQPNAIEIGLLEWLVDQRMITFEDDRLEWVGLPS